MEGLGDSYTDNEGKASFWKKNVKAVPGRPSPKKDPRGSRQRNASCSTSYQDFQDSVNDAWDIGDDEFCIVSDVKISKRVAQSAALSVINSHRYTASGDSSVNVSGSQPCDFAIPEEKKIEAIQRLASQREPPMLSPAHGIATTPQISSSPPVVKHFPGRPQQLRGNQAKSKFHFASREGQDCETSKLERFQPLLESTLLNLEDLRQLSWSGIPVKVRAITWRLLSIHIDIPRMSPLIALFQQKTVQEMFERILFIWAIRHPASGYVQGINDLVTPFYVVFLQEVIPTEGDLENWNVESLPKEQRDIIEADSFWCLSKFLDGIQDNYIFAQLGIQHKVNQLKELIQRIDAVLMLLFISSSSSLVLTVMGEHRKWPPPHWGLNLGLAVGRRESISF